MPRYSTAAMAAFALGASAMPAPQWGHWPSWVWGDSSDDAPTYGAPSAAPEMPAPVPSYVQPSAPAPSLPAPSVPAPSGVIPPVSMPAPFPSGNATAPSYVGAASGSMPLGSSCSVSYSYVPSSSAVYSYAPSSSAAASAPAVTSAAAVVPSGGASSGGDMPASSGTSVLSAVQTIAAGENFDGGMVAFDRGVSCTGQEEGGDSDAVFEIEDGGSLSNVIIGPNQIEGVHCYGSCTLTNVWWAAVCEDAFTIKEQPDGSTTTISGGGAFGADDKVLQHNGGGTLSVSGFTVDDFGKLYRSCGNCDSMYERHVIFDDITATSGSVLAGINSNYGDTATFSNIKISDVGDVCVTYTGNDTGDEPEENGSGPSESCIYDESDILES